MTPQGFAPPTTATGLGTDALSDATSDAPCAVALYPIPDFSLRDPVGAVVDRLRLTCWGTMLFLCAGTVMTIAAVHWALGTSAPVTALHRIRVFRRRRADGDRIAPASTPLRFPTGRLAARMPFHATRRWEPPLAKTA